MVRIGGGVPPGGVTPRTGEKWEFLETGIKDVYWMYQSSATPFFAMTGSAVDVKIRFKVPVSIVAIMVEHTDATDVLNTNNFTWEFGTYANQVPFFADIFPFIEHSISSLSQFIETFADLPDAMLPLPSGDYILRMNTTNTHRVRVRFLIKLTEEVD